MNEHPAALILEDEAILAFALEDMLLEMGFAEVAVASTIEEANQLLENWAPALAILDVNIRGERSYGVAQRLGESGIPLVFATGYGDAERPEAFAHIPTLTKPYGLEQLRTVLQSLPVCEESGDI